MSWCVFLPIWLCRTWQWLPFLSFSPSFVLVHTSTQPTLPGIPDPLNLLKTSSWQGACQHALMSWPGWVSAYHAHARAVSHVQQQQGCERCGRQLGIRKTMSQRAVLRPLMRCQMWAHHLLSASSGKSPQSQKAHQFPATTYRMACCSSKTGFLGRMGWQQGKKLRAGTTNQHLPGPALLADSC